MMLPRILILVGPLPGVNERAGLQRGRLAVRRGLGERVQIRRVAARLDLVHLGRLREDLDLALGHVFLGAFQVVHINDAARSR